MSDQLCLASALQCVDDFRRYLCKQGYAEGTIKHYGHSCRHFVVWLGQRQIALANIDDDVVERFAVHKCECPPECSCKMHGETRHISPWSTALCGTWPRSA